MQIELNLIWLELELRLFGFFLYSRVSTWIALKT